MPKWVPQHVSFSSQVTGGNLNDHLARVSVYREVKDKYVVDVDITPPGESRMMVSGSSIRDADLNRMFSSAEQALRAGFRSLIRALNNNGKNTLENTTEMGADWVYVKDDGSIDWKETHKTSNEKERTKSIEITIPTSEATRAIGREHQIGTSYSADIKLTGLDESGDDLEIGESSPVDGVEQAAAGLARFMGTRGMTPALPEETEPELKELKVPNKNGPKSGGTLAQDEPALPVAAPGSPFPA